MKIRNFLIFIVHSDCACADIALFINIFLPDSRTKLQVEIQSLIKTACLELAANTSNKSKAASKKTSDKPPTIATENNF